MRTTDLIVELLVIGTGALGWLTCIVVALFGYDWIDLDDVSALAAILPVVSLVYLLGIVTDRVADALFGPAADKIRLKEFDSADAFRDARNELYQEEPFRSMLEYNRSRLRICRGWTLNAVLLLIATNLVIWTEVSDVAPRMQLTVFTSLSLVILAAGSLFSWYRLFSAECSAVKTRRAGMLDTDQS